MVVAVVEKGRREKRRWKEESRVVLVERGSAARADIDGFFGGERKMEAYRIRDDVVKI